MFYQMYLSGVCSRRQWPAPAYESYEHRDGWYSKVRVNNREYCTDCPYATEELAVAGAATKAYMICRNFSSNDGYYPGQRPGQMSTNGVVQGVPVPIGHGRRASRRSYDSNHSDSSNSPTNSPSNSPVGGNTPTSIDSGFAQQMRQVTQQVPHPAGRRPTHQRKDEYFCLCQRGSVFAYGSCRHCLREKGWA